MTAPVLEIRNLHKRFGKVEVLKGIECVEYGCSLHNIAQGEQLDVSRGINCAVTYEPVGVCAGVVPFNFPTMVPLWMLPQALVTGNTFVLKPSEQVPYGSMKLALLFKEAGLPDGVLNVVNGDKVAVDRLHALGGGSDHFAWRHIAIAK